MTLLRVSLLVLLVTFSGAAFAQGVTLPEYHYVELDNGAVFILTEKRDVPLVGADLSNQGTLVTLNAPTRTYAIEDAVVGPGETTTLVATGSPGDIVFSAISYGSLANYQPSLFGTQLFTAPNAIAALSTIHTASRRVAWNSAVSPSPVASSAGA